MSNSSEHSSSPHPHSAELPLPTTPQHRPRWNRPRTSQPPATPGFARWDPRHHRWHNAALRIAGRETIHAVRADQTDSGGQRVAPACHTGHDRGDDSHTLQPIYDKPVNCKNCRTYPLAHEEGRPYNPNDNNWMLPLDLPPIERWPSGEQ